MLSGAQGGAFIGLYGGVFAFWQKHTSAPPRIRSYYIVVSYALQRALKNLVLHPDRNPKFF